MAAAMTARPRVLGVIPARLGSTRLPRKPLRPLAGRPLIEWVWRRASRLDTLDAVVVATDSDEIAAVCEGFGATVEPTAASHASGTERVAEVAARAAYHGYDVVVNVQGDEPFVGDAQVGGAVGRVVDGWDIGTVAAPLGSLEAWRDPAVVKVVVRQDGGALYFSRAPVPFARDGDPVPDDLASERYLRHIGVYAFTPEALQRWVALPAHWLEGIERLEQLRPLAAGMGIGVALTELPEASGVDTPEDLETVEARIVERRELFISMDA